MTFFCDTLNTKVENFEMSKRSRLFVVAVLIAIVYSANAAPSVKVLGTKKSENSNNGAALKLDSQTLNKSVPGARLGSVKVSNLQKAKPVTMNKSVASGKNTIGDNRLSIGKYIHSVGVQSNVIKPVTQSAPAASSDDFLNLQDRVQRVETELSMKQNALQAGDGVVIEDGVIGLSQDVDGLVSDVTSLQEQMGNVYTKSEITNLLDSHGVGEGNTVYDANRGERKYVTFLFEEDFSESIFDDL